MAAADAVENNVHAIAQEAASFFHEVLMLVVNRNAAQTGYDRSPARRTGPEHLQSGEATKLQQRRADPACRTVNQHALAGFYFGGAMQHLVCRDVVQNEAHSLGGVQAGWYGDQFTMGQADEFCVRTGDRQGGHDLTWFESRDAVAKPIHHAHQIPARRERHGGRFGVNALAHHQIRQGNAGGQHPHPHLAAFRLRALFFSHLNGIGSAIVIDDYACVSHEPSDPKPASALQLYHLCGFVNRDCSDFADTLNGRTCPLGPYWKLDRRADAIQVPHRSSLGPSPIILAALNIFI